MVIIKDQSLKNVPHFVVHVVHFNSVVQKCGTKVWYIIDRNDIFMVEMTQSWSNNYRYLYQLMACNCRALQGIPPLLEGLKGLKVLRLEDLKERRYFCT